MNHLYTLWQEAVNARNEAFSEWRRTCNRNESYNKCAAAHGMYLRAAASAERTYTAYIVYADQAQAA